MSNHPTRHKACREAQAALALERDNALERVRNLTVEVERLRALVYGAQQLMRLTDYTEEWFTRADEALEEKP